MGIGNKNDSNKTIGSLHNYFKFDEKHPLKFFQMPTREYKLTEGNLTKT